MPRMLRTLLASISVVILCLVAGAGGAMAAPAEEGGSTVAPTPFRKSHPGQKRVAADITWGKRIDGSRWFVLNKGDLATPSEAERLSAPPAPTIGPRAVSASCNLTLTEFELDGITQFSWLTEQICIGDFGQQDLTTQLQRTSWRGWLGYSAWATYPAQLSNNSYIETYWYVACNHEHGFYDYKAVAQGWASNVGRSPTVRSGNYIDQADCGPNAG